MSDSEKDRWGDKLHDAEKAREDKFFADRDAELVGKLKARTGVQEEQSVREVARAGATEKVTGRAKTGWLSRIFGRSS
jgi:hypothetical protein